MRLSKIKLAGFKSFVDPTSIGLPSNLIGIVGPNGCGKSNVIDAVRWVMGELSAKHLRGDSMADVIFNGSSARKPVGSAAIELVFDNSDGLIGGQYAGYNEISIRRVVSRDGTSNYYLNGTRCRRKDITNIFLGTGLGSRSYAIIEQGMISRLIEAKPEDLRMFLEEAAGISRYKERRRETENRIAHTRENLERLNDLREEVEKQIRHLQRQASLARRYQEYRQEERRAKAELLALRLRDLDEASRAREALLAQCQTAVEAAVAEQRALENGIEKAREAHTERSEAMNQVQGSYYRIGAEIARLEQAIQHGRELRQRQRQDLEEAIGNLEQIRRHMERDRGELAELARALEELQPGLQNARTAEAGSAEALQRTEEAMQRWRDDWETHTREHNATEQRVQVERARIEQLEHQLQRLHQQRNKLQAEQGQISLDSAQAQLHSLAEREAEVRREHDGVRRCIDDMQSQIQTLREQDCGLMQRLDAARSESQKDQGRLASLEALQQAALGQTKGRITDWLVHHGLAERPRLAQQLEVERGWERAVETVLGRYLQAVCVEEIDPVVELLGSLESGSLTFVAPAQCADRAVGQTLLGKVRGAAVPNALLARVRIVESLADALRLRARLDPEESVITREGVWLSRQWLRVGRDEDGRDGVLVREQEIRTLRSKLSSEIEQAAVLESELDSNRQALKHLERQRDQAQEALAERNRRLADAQAQLQTAHERWSEQQAQRQSLDSEVTEIGAELAQAEAQLTESRTAIARDTAALAEFESRRLVLEQLRGRLHEELEQARDRAGRDREAVQSIAIQVESRRSTEVSASTGLARMESQFRQFSVRKEELERELDAGGGPLEEQTRTLGARLEQRLGIERELAERRREVETAENLLRGLERQRGDKEGQVGALREELETARLAAQELRVRREGLTEQFGATKFQLAPMVAELPEDASIAAWEENLVALAARIERLGPINLAAIDELAQHSQRKEYLDAQNTDLQQALDTLENAMRKIDRETRTRFKETFDRVNLGLKEKFPRLFGGGHAYLELAGEDLLSAGVTVMARPPGKRISTIHLLSGGEKALTAVALVFAIFDLNPAPFCLLDEVDAPLDDANVGRFCDIVREMSARTQFVFITHNKSTMELAEQLIGVTMNEPGVSRLVAVDVGEAVRMAAM